MLKLGVFSPVQVRGRQFDLAESIVAKYQVLKIRFEFDEEWSKQYSSRSFYSRRSHDIFGFSLFYGRPFELASK